MSAETGIVLAALEDSGSEDCAVEIARGSSARPCMSSEARVRTCFGIFAAAFVAVGLAMFIAITLQQSQVVDGPAPAQTVCGIAAAGAGRWYPAPTNPRYYVDFNQTTRQPNYVLYTAPAAGRPAATPGSYWPASDPYGQGVLPPSCYNARGAPGAASGFQRGRLAPGAIFGPAANFMAAAVPMTPAFSQGAWRTLTARIRGEFAGARVAVGCGYAGGRTVPAEAVRGCRDVARPDGCYFLVFAPGGGLPQSSRAAVLASGYYANDGGGVKEDHLPWWAACE